MTKWLIGLAVSLTGLLGLFLASRAVDTGMYAFGLLAFLFAVWLDFWFIKTGFDAAEAAQAEAAAAVEPLPAEAPLARAA